MIVNRRHFQKMAVAALAFCTLVTTNTYAEKAKFNWTFQTSSQAGDNFFPMKQAWAKRVGIMSGGRIEIKIVPVGTVVQYNETLEAVGSGILQGHITDPSYFSGKNPAFGMLGNLVGAWSSPDQLFKFIEYGGGKALFNKLMNPYGLHFIGATTTGLEAFVSKKPLNGVNDLKGLKMRAPEGMVQEVFAKAGASPVNLPGSEVYTSLEKGVIDAADYTVFSTNHKLGLHKFAKYPLYPGFHSMPVLDVSVNKAEWDKLPADLKLILEVSVRDFAYDMTSRLEAENAAAIIEAQKDPSIKIINWNNEERAKFRAIAQSEWKNWAARNDLTKEVFETVTSYMKKSGMLK